MDKTTKATDEMLVARYAQGENEAFDMLLDRHKERLYTYIYYNVRNTEQAEDIFQETFAKAIVTIQQGRYSESGKFLAWLTRIAHNLIIDYFRQEKQECLVSCDEEERNLQTVCNSRREPSNRKSSATKSCPTCAASSSFCPTTSAK